MPCSDGTVAPLALGGAFFAGLFLAACAPADADSAATGSEDAGAPAASRAPAGDTGSASAPISAPPTVEVVAHDFAFEAPDTIRAGWTRFHFRNDGAQTHFFVLDHLPEGRGLEDFAAAAAAPFDSAMRGLEAGTLDKAQAAALLGRMLPAWFGGVEQTGGVGLLAPGWEADAVVRLDPGTYVIECYVKTPDGVFHTSLGMARQLTVSGPATEAVAPDADLAIAFVEGSMDAPAEVSAGAHTVAVRYRSQPEAGLANDVSVVRLEDGQTPADVVPWMDWMNPEGLRAPAPATFVGGVQEVPEGGTAYFTVDLEPGRYAWISENAGRGMVEEFTVR